MRALGFTYFSHGPSVSARPCHRRRRIHRQPRGEGAARARRHASSSTTISAGPPRGRRGTASALSKATSSDAAKLAAVLQDARSRCGDAFCRVAVGGRLGQRSDRLLPQQRRRAPCQSLEAMVAAGVKHFVFSSTCAIFGTPETTPIHEDLRQRPINAYGETKLAIEHALPHFELAYGIRSSRSATSTPPAPIRTASSARITRRRFTSSRAPSMRRWGGDLSDVWRRLSDAGRHLPPRLRPRHRPCLGALARARMRSRSGGALDAYNLGNGRPTSVRDVHESVERVTGKPVPYDVAPRRAGRSGGALRVERARAPRSRLAAAIRGPRRHRRDRLALACGPPAGLCDGDALMSRLKGQLTDPLLSVVMPAYNERGHDRRDHPPRAGRSAPHRAHRRRRRLEGRHARHPDARCRASCRSSCFCRRRTRGKGAALRARLPGGHAATSSSSRTPTSNTRRRSFPS